ncbi:unnamed protein product [Mytilus edulis]|uniref:Uncharacterized protein n=1 Tax=Mytilus edulis TaxID=6550 RepID=A0A8S3VRI1_MYTED|nr:unnamed protein product [Mytilus edulis]
MTTELETNIVAVERVKEYTETPTEIPVERVKEYTETQGVVSENDNRVRDKHCSCRESEGIHRNSYRGVVSENDNRVRDKHCSCRESEGIHRNSYRGVVSENDNRVRDKHCSCRESEGIHRNSYRVRMTTELETNIVAVERVKEYTETPTEVNSSYFIYIPTQGVVSENDNRVRDKHCSCRESEGIHRNSYRGK